MRPYDTIIQNKKTIITIYITSQQRYRNGNMIGTNRMKNKKPILGF